MLGTLEAWENRELGADEQFATPAPLSVELDAQIDGASALCMISIGLPATLFEDFKNIATVRGGAMRKAA